MQAATWAITLAIAAPRTSGRILSHRGKCWMDFLTQADVIKADNGKLLRNLYAIGLRELHQLDRVDV